jgi:hypothetical protein
MSANNSRQERFDRLERRNTTKFEEEKENIVKSNIAEIDETIAEFRKEILILAHMSSLGDPASAMSSAISSPEFMLKSLLLVLDTQFRTRDSANKERVHFEIKGNTLLIRDVSREYRSGRDKVLKDIPRIEVKIGALQLASSGRANGHRCEQLLCTNNMHGATKIFCPHNAQHIMDRSLRSEEINTQIISEDGKTTTRDVSIMKFKPFITRNALWQHCVRISEPNVFYDPVYTVTYFQNEITVLPHVIVYLLCVLFGPDF